MATTPMRLGSASSSKHKLKAALVRIARRTARAQHAGKRLKRGEAPPPLPSEDGTA